MEISIKKEETRAIPSTLGWLLQGLRGEGWEWGAQGLLSLHSETLPKRRKRKQMEVGGKKEGKEAKKKKRDEGKDLVALPSQT